MVDIDIPDGYTERINISSTVVKAWYECADPLFPCPVGNLIWTKTTVERGVDGSHGGCSNCAMTGITWSKMISPPPLPGTDNITGLMILTAAAIGAFLLLRGKK